FAASIGTEQIFGRQCRLERICHDETQQSLLDVLTIDSNGYGMNAVDGGLYLGLQLFRRQVDALLVARCVNVYEVNHWEEHRRVCGDVAEARHRPSTGDARQEPYRAPLADHTSFAGRIEKWAYRVRNRKSPLPPFTSERWQLTGRQALRTCYFTGD